MNMTKTAVDNRWLTITLIAVLLLGGFQSFRAMPKDDMPPFLIRSVSIVTSFPGASPERVEQLVTDPIEKAVQEISQVDYISSESRPGVSVITVNLKESEYDLRPIFDHIRRKVDEVRPLLPEDSSPTVNDELGDVFGILIGITGEGFTFAELKKISDEVRDRLIKLPEVARVEIRGEQPERIYITYDEARLSSLGLSHSHIAAMIQATNIIFPGGNVTIGQNRISLEPSGNFENIEDLKNLIISQPGSPLILRLRDVARIERGYMDPPDNHVRINGIPGMVLGCSLKKEGNILEMGGAIDREIREMEKIYPHGVTFIRVASQDTKVNTAIRNFTGNLIQSVVVVLATMFLFLGLRTGFVVSSLIPSAILCTFFVMSFLGVGLNQVSLASLIIALGMLVDNAIVMSEAMMVRMESGEKKLDAALAASRELAIPLLVSSLTTAAAFVSFYLANSVMGEIMGQLFLVVSTALLASWLLSLSLIPMLAMQWIRVTKSKKEETGPIARIRNQYETILIRVLKKPKTFALCTALLFIASLGLFRFIPFVFFADSDTPMISANLELPVGVDISLTDQVTRELETFIQNELLAEHKGKGVTHFAAFVGKGAPKYDLGYRPPESAPYTAHILLNTTGDDVNDAVKNAVYDFALNHFPDVTAKVSRLKSGGGSEKPIAIRITGDDPERLYALGERVKTKLRSIQGTRNVADDWGLRSRKFRILIDQNRAHLAGLSSQDVAASLQTLLSGSATGIYREKEHNIPIIMIRENPGIMDIAALEGLPVHSPSTGRSVPLKQVADIELVWEPAKILRRDLHRTLTVSSETAGNITAAAVMASMKPWLTEDAREWGRGYGYELGGEAEDSAKAMGAVMEKLPISFFVIILLLIAQFNSIKKPLIVLLTIPLGITGVALGLFVFRSSFGFMAFLGVISLAGIVINNAIVLLDRIRIEKEENGLTPEQAVVTAACQRFRPILLTTATTALGLIPLWIGGGPMWQPMAITIFSGLIFATVITLLFVPVCYSLFYGLRPEKSASGMPENRNDSKQGKKNIDFHAYGA
ncbi:efflux RND transporter permease subunit [Desulfobotulus sp. H1]|uniref:Efflux RND transporter permease subunit n=1 Tax=Desulfobotulus pelophilus TaxID=2823377 RepID=A0ABT3NBT8_9BACT|nr:efflux RND transporter permease subunit [Desulfobotulus pelophilus]MCW7754932.1 efflux RND transporter permease subunit [Desulfobotulus pelophilus]